MPPRRLLMALAGRASRPPNGGSLSPKSSRALSVSVSLNRFLVAHKADRVARDVYVSELVKRELRAAGAAVALVEGICGDDPFSEMAATVMDAAARLERRLIAARTKAALAVKKGKGEKTGGAMPFGFELLPDGVHLVPHPVEHKVLIRVLELRRAGLGGRRIAATLISEGHRPRASAWDPGNLQRLADRLIAEGMGLDQTGTAGALAAS